MEFGYFTLSDNHYDNNPRTPNQFVADITDEAIYADRLGMHSAWIGEHHFNSLGVLSCPDLVLAYIAARTQRIRLAPAVTVLPLHHPIRVAEQWATLDLLSNGRVDFAAGRGYDAREYLPFKVDFSDNQGIFEEGMELVRTLWSAEGRIPWTDFVKTGGEALEGVAAGPLIALARLRGSTQELSLKILLTPKTNERASGSCELFQPPWRWSPHRSLHIESTGPLGLDRGGGVFAVDQDVGGQRGSYGAHAGL